MPLSAPEWTLSVPYVPAKLVFGNRFGQVAFNPLAELRVAQGTLRPTLLLLGLGHVPHQVGGARPTDQTLDLRRATHVLR